MSVGRDLGNIGTDTRASPRKINGGAHDKRHSIAVRAVRRHETANIGVRNDHYRNLVPTILRNYMRLQSPSCCCKFHILAFCSSINPCIPPCHVRTSLAWVEKTSVRSYRTVPRTRYKPYHIQKLERNTVCTCIPRTTSSRRQSPPNTT